MYCETCDDFVVGYCAQHDPQPRTWTQALHDIAEDLAGRADGLAALLAMLPAGEDPERAKRAFEWAQGRRKPVARTTGKRGAVDRHYDARMGWRRGA